MIINKPNVSHRMWDIWHLTLTNQSNALYLQSAGAILCWLNINICWLKIFQVVTGERLLVTSLLRLYSYRAAGREAREVWTAPGFTVLLLYCQQAGRPVPTQPARHGQKSNWKSLSGSYIFIVPPAHSDILQEESDPNGRSCCLTSLHIWTLLSGEMCEEGDQDLDVTALGSAGDWA